jgi:hypothetical protein
MKSIIEILASEPLALLALISGLICLGIYVGIKSSELSQRVILLVGGLLVVNSFLLGYLYSSKDYSGARFIDTDEIEDPVDRIRAGGRTGYGAPRINQPIPLQARPRSVNKLYEGIQRALDEISDGYILFNPPLKMLQGKKERIEARVSVGDIGEALTNGLRGKGVPEKVHVKVGPIMKVKLYSNKEEFEITNYSNEEQAVAGKSYTQWEWDVLPTKYGDNELHLKATISLNVEGLGNQSRDLEVIDKTITVHVNRWFITKKIVENNWQWISGSLIIPIIVWVYKNRLGKGSKTKQDSKIEGSKESAQLQSPPDDSKP